MRKITVFIALAFLLTLCAIPVYAADIPPLPHAFYGDLDINNASAPIGTEVEARGEGVRNGIAGNPIETGEAGKYGSADPLGSKLIVQGDIADGATLTFYVSRDGINWVKAETEPAPVEWHSGEVSKINLSVTIEAPPPVEAPEAVGLPTYYLLTNLFGVEARFRIELDGELRQIIEATSQDSMLTITIAKGTIALDKDGKRLKRLEVAVDENPPGPPEDAHVIGLAYDFRPEGATFDPPITLLWNYDPAALPAGVAEEDLVVAFYDEEVGEWEVCPCECDTEGNCIAASICHCTTFAIIGAVTPPPPPPAPVPPPPPAPPAPPPVVAPVPAPPPPVVPAPAPPPTPPVPPPPPAPPPELEVPPNWPLIGGIIGGVVIVGLLIFFLVRRRAA